MEAAGNEGEGGSRSTTGPSHGSETKHKTEIMLVQMRKKGNNQVVIQNNSVTFIYCSTISTCKRWTG